jgi:hypothetical protein
VLISEDAQSVSIMLPLAQSAVKAVAVVVDAEVDAVADVVALAIVEDVAVDAEVDVAALVIVEDVAVRVVAVVAPLTVVASEISKARRRPSKCSIS